MYGESVSYESWNKRNFGEKKVNTWVLKVDRGGECIRTEETDGVIKEI